VKAIIFSCVSAMLCLLQPAQASLSEQRTRYAPALAAAHAGKLSAKDRDLLAGYPLLPYIELAELSRDIARNDPAKTAQWLRIWGKHLPLANRLRESTLTHLAKQQDWQTFLKFYDKESASAAQRCNAWTARMQLMPDKELGVSHARALVLEPTAPHPHCAQALTFFASHAADAESLLQKRFALQLAASLHAEAAATTRYLPSNVGTNLLRRLQAESQPEVVLKAAQQWPVDAHHKAIVVRALERIAKRQPKRIASLLQAQQRFDLQRDDLLPVLREQVRFALIENWPEADPWLAELPHAARDTQIHEWAVRRALQRRDPKETLARLDAMPAALLNTAKWRYVRARVLEWLTQPEAARADFQAASGEAGFYGFLAADRLGIGYALCSEDSGLDRTRAKTLLESAALPRIEEFFARNDGVGAKREWMHLIGQQDAALRRQAGIIASERGWAELAILALNQPQDRRLYAHRFPLLESKTLHSQAQKYALDPAFVAGLIRQESAWNPKIASHAGAIGLMQMLPSTAKITAKTLGITHSNIDLRDAKTNLKLGTKHLYDLAQKHQGSPILMTAAYNAGPNALKRWIDPLYQSYPDLWIETVPYKETREYIATVLAFTVIYDYRFDQKLTRLSDRVPEFAGLKNSPANEQHVPLRCTTPAIAGLQQ
jgi:soluble lytic murein transglycosylase